MATDFSIDEYPNFDSGDVLVIAPSGHSWRLHFYQLQCCSSVLAEILGKAPDFNPIDSDSFKSTSILFQLEIQVVDMDKQDFKIVATKPGTIPRSMLSKNNVNGIAGPPEFIKIYDNFFRAMYDLEPNAVPAYEGKTVVREALALLDIADGLDAVAVVQVQIGKQFLRAGPVLWRQIMSNPCEWADVAIRLHSPEIFREAMCHIVGAWKIKRGGIDRDYLRQIHLGDKVIELAQAKVDELDQFKRHVEIEIMEYFPNCMMHKTAETGTGKNPGRGMYASDIYLWQGLSLIRQYLSANQARDYSWRAEDGGAKFYREIADGATKYLARSALNPFFETFHMSEKGRDCLENAVHYLKQELRVLVECLVIDRTRLAKCADPPEHKYLTCVEIEDREMPWYEASEASSMAAADGDEEDLEV